MKRSHLPHLANIFVILTLRSKADHESSFKEVNAPEVVHLMRCYQMPGDVDVKSIKERTRLGASTTFGF